MAAEGGADRRGADIGPTRLEACKEHRQHRAIGRFCQNLRRPNDASGRVCVMNVARHSLFSVVRCVDLPKSPYRQWGSISDNATDDCGIRAPINKAEQPEHWGLAGTRCKFALAE